MLSIFCKQKLASLNSTMYLLSFIANEHACCSKARQLGFWPLHLQSIYNTLYLAGSGRNHSVKFLHLELAKRVQLKKPHLKTHFSQLSGLKVDEYYKKIHAITMHTKSYFKPQGIGISRSLPHEFPRKCCIFPEI